MKLEEIDNKLARLWRSVNKDTPFLELGETMIELSVWNTELGYLLPQLHLETTSVEGKRFLHYKNENSSDTKAALLAKYDSAEARKLYERAKYLWKSCDALANRIQSWLNVLKAEQRMGGKIT